MIHDFAGFPGTKRYLPLRLLGVGGMGAVYEVEDRETGGRVALKVMLADDARRLLRFKQEFRVMAELHHPNLIRLFDLGQHEGQWFFTMELVDGHDLLAVLLLEDGAAAGSSADTIEAPLDGGHGAADGEAPAPTARREVACDVDALTRILAQVLDALEFLHDRGIVHRDLKPSNILVDVDGAVRVLDFGLASRVDRELGISQEGAVVGTLAYLSPEQLRGEAASPASDLYALGCLTFQLLTGAPPFPGAPLAALAARNERPPPRVDEQVSGAPPALVDLVQGLMAREPAERPTLAAARAALGAGAGRPGGRTGAAGGPREDTAEIFIGRQRELAILAGCVERAAGGQAELVLVSGPSGIGKSALGGALARRAARLGFLCFRGRCYEREQVPFIAFDRVVDALTLTLRRWPPGRLAPLAPALRALTRLFPALGMLTPDAGAEPAAADPRELRRQALDGFQRLVDACQAEAPLCFVLDDLQWADEESLALLDTLLARGAGRIIVLGLVRSEGGAAAHPLEGLRRALAGAEHVTALALDALAASDAALLVRAVTGGRLDPALSGALVEQAEGNPFLVRRLAEHLATLGPAERSGSLDALGTAEDLLRRMMAGLSPRAEEVLALAATAGGDVATRLLRAAGALDGADLELAIAELMAGRFFKAVPPAAGAEAGPRLDLYHDRIREVVYEGLPAERRRALHRRLAVAIEAQAREGGRDAEALVRHWTAAGERVEARRHALAAAEQAAGKLAFLRAARLFRVVLDEPAPGEAPRVTAGRWERAGELYEYGGHHLDAARAYEEARRRWDDAPAPPTERRVARLRLLGLAGENLLATPHLAEGRAAFARGLALLDLPLTRPVPGRVATIVALRAQLALAERLPDLRPPRRGDPAPAAEVRFLDRLVRAFQPFWPAPAAEAALRAELLGRRLDDPAVLVRSLVSSAALPFFLGRCTPAQLDAAHLRLDAAEELARAQDVPLGRELVQLHRSLIWLGTSLVRARRTCEAALAGFARHGLHDSYDGTVARAYYLYVLLWNGADDDALALMAREIGRDPPSFVNLAVARAERAALLARRGEPGAARADLEGLEAQLEGTPPSRLDFLLARTRAAVLVAEGRGAEVVAEAELHERAARATSAWAVGIDRSAWLELQLDAALQLLRRGALSPRGRGRAREQARWLVARGALTYGCLGLGALARLDDAEGRRSAALTSLRRALALSSANSAPYHRWRCLEAARELGALTLDQAIEAAEIGAAGRYVAPPG
jgi:hypothetical protein